MDIDMKALREVMEAEEIKIPKEPDYRKVDRGYNDLERAISSATKNISYSEKEELVENIETIESELNWFSGEWEEMRDYAENAENIIHEMGNEIDSLLRSLYYRMDEDEKEAYKIAAVKNQIRGQ